MHEYQITAPFRECARGLGVEGDFDCNRLGHLIGGCWVADCAVLRRAAVAILIRK